MRSRSWGAAAVAISALLLGAVPGAAAGASEGITVETPEGPVTCAADPELEPGPEATSVSPFVRGVRVTINDVGGLRCQTPMFGEVELTGAGLPWRLTVNEKSSTARLKGSRNPGLRIQSVVLPSLACVYQTGSVLGTLTAGLAPSVAVHVRSLRLNKPSSSSLCPAFGPLDLNVALP